MRNFSLEERMFIEKSLKAGLTCTQIGSELKRHPKSIFNEIKNRRTKDGYFGEVAHADYEEGTKRRYAHMVKTFSEEEKKYIVERFSTGISICAIAAELATSPQKITIYLNQSRTRRDYIGQEIGVMERLQALEEQIKILSEIVKELKNDSKNNKLQDV